MLHRLQLAAAAAAILASAPAAATIVGYAPEVDLSALSTPYTVSFGDATYSFAFDPTNFYSPVTVSVGGTGLVYGNTPLEVGIPSAFQQGTIVPDQLSLGEFFAPDGFKNISFSIAEDWIALAFTNGGDTFYGYAQVGGSYLDQIALNDTPGGPIATGQAIEAAPGAVPEPATWALSIGGFGLVGGALRRRPQVPARA